MTYEVVIAATIVNGSRVKTATYQVTQETALSFLLMSTKDSVRTVELNIGGDLYWLRSDVVPSYDIGLNLTGLHMELVAKPR